MTKKVTRDMRKIIQCFSKDGKRIGCNHYADETCECRCHKQQIRPFLQWYRLDNHGNFIKRKHELLVPYYVTKKEKCKT